MDEFGPRHRSTPFLTQCPPLRPFSKENLRAMKDSLHLLNSDSEQDITGPERKLTRCGTHKFKLLSDRLPAAFPPTGFVVQCSAGELGLVSPSTQKSQG